VTEPELALPMRRTPGSGIRSDAAVRARKQTLLSPIPALLAASMGEIREGKNDATPLPIDLRTDSTSRLDEADVRSLLFDDDSEYVVEVVDPAKPTK
jgi:hypothetical protein